MEKRQISYSLIFLLIIFSGVIYYFLGFRYDLSILSKLFISAVTFLLLFYAYIKGPYYLTLVISTGLSIFLSLGISFGKVYETDSPFASNLILGPWNIFFLSVLSCLIIVYLYKKIQYKDKFPLLLFILFVVVWIILAFNTKYFEDWKMENWLTLPFVILILITYRWFKLSNISYTMIFTFMVLHIVGSHFTYAEVPFGFWMQSFFGLTRNNYDRIVHFAFGLLFAYPIREVSKRIGSLKGLWAFWIPIELILALSCIYELMEWAVAAIFGGDLGIAYLGSQGDIWDAQKDMLNAGIGALITMIVTSFIIMYYNSKGFWREFKESLSVKNKEPLGEVALAKLKQNKNN